MSMDGLSLEAVVGIGHVARHLQRARRYHVHVSYDGLLDLCEHAYADVRGAIVSNVAGAEGDTEPDHAHFADVRAMAGYLTRRYERYWAPDLHRGRDGHDRLYAIDGLLDVIHALRG